MTSFTRFVNGVLTTVQIDSFDESIAYPSGLSAATNITIPNSKSFTTSDASDILIIANNTLREVTRDFTVVGSGPTYTQIQFIYDLPTNTTVRFIKHVV